MSAFRPEADAADAANGYKDDGRPEVQEWVSALHGDHVGGTCCARDARDGPSSHCGTPGRLIVGRWILPMSARDIGLARTAGRGPVSTQTARSSRSAVFSWRRSSWKGLRSWSCWAGRRDARSWPVADIGIGRMGNWCQIDGTPSFTVALNGWAVAVAGVRIRSGHCDSAHGRTKWGTQ